jgi:hypothetical protein
MIWGYAQLLNLKPMVRRNARKDFSNLPSNIFSTSYWSFEDFFLKV